MKKNTVRTTLDEWFQKFTLDLFTTLQIKCLECKKSAHLREYVLLDKTFSCPNCQKKVALRFQKMIEK